MVISQSTNDVQTTNIIRTSPVRESPQRKESPPYATATKQTISAQISNGESANAVITTDYQVHGSQRSTAIIKTQASPPTVQPELNNMPPPPPPPPAVPPVVTKTTLEKRTSNGSAGKH